MEDALKAEEKWYFYPSNQEEAIEINDGRPIFKLNYEKDHNIKVTSDSSDDFFTTIRKFNNKNQKNKSKVKQYIPSFY